jgi:metallo-beta-lactamase class B
MKLRVTALGPSICTICLATMIGSASLRGQTAGDTIQAHVMAAKAAAGQEHTALFETLCAQPAAPAPAAAASTAPLQGATPPGPPNRALWHAEPVKVFDNLYFLGMTEYSAWAVNTSDGIILVDSIYDYSVEDEVVKGLPKVGLDPANIKYVIVSHGHIDHAGGAKLLQDRYGAHVILSAADWDLLARDTGSWPKPKRDMVATDGQRLTLGGETLTMYLTPGHTLGTISTLIPVTDGGKPHLVAEWGGTAFNWIANPSAYITSDRPGKFWFKTYSESAQRFRDVVAKAGADVLISNHTVYDGSKTKLPALALRKPGAPNPYVIGNDSVQRYLIVAHECAEAGLLRVQ